ncbi:GNAT family N-acetyltransferase [Streptomyces sp. NPDC088354]|uniref:GNAT family N-acetyltransferase n=1 Tax=unclassified Streptomyces TaxID=2593676 RepID=UPI0029BBD4E9|nr:GNAT family N-acetyltransferase [Streptomyces sp. MI02-7b]MDX3072833.1 GNAT family N-acetyltransferase [Streptomyces sp. MI02-7b]
MTPPAAGRAPGTEPAGRVPGTETIRALQERAAGAQTAEHQQDADGCWLRHAHGCAWWVGAALPHGPAAPGELPGRVGGAEEFSAAHGAPARFQITPGVCPEGLDSPLAGRGYRRDGPASSRTAVTARVAGAPSAGAVRVRVAERPTREWFDGRLAVRGHRADPHREWDLPGRVEGPGVFGMGTLPAARGRGAAGGVRAAPAGRAGAVDAGRMCLQVERHNTAAVRPCARAGFGEVAACHYRVAD